MRARRRKAKSFIADEESMMGREIQVILQSELEVIGIDPVFLSFSF